MFRKRHSGTRWANDNQFAVIVIAWLVLSLLEIKHNFHFYWKRIVWFPYHWRLLWKEVVFNNKYIIWMKFKSNVLPITQNSNSISCHLLCVARARVRVYMRTCLRAYMLTGVAPVLKVLGSASSWGTRRSAVFFNQFANREAFLCVD